MLIVDLRRATTPGRIGSTVVVLAFGAALGCHESGVMMLPAALVLRYGRGERKHLREWAREYAGCLGLLVAYVTLTAWINSRNYVITEGHYRLGTHIVTNLFDYLIALYAGRRRLVEYIFVIGLSAVIAWRGSAQVRAWYVWMLIALAPVLPFSWGTSSRYLYVPSIPFTFLVAGGILWLRAAIAGSRPSPLRRSAAMILLIAASTFVVARSALFARKGVVAFSCTDGRIQLHRSSHAARQDRQRREN